ncbi:YciI family protein [Brevibacterium sp. 50QC2O2]|uniref:YciI family protein n=1 Tax=Brevibacterium TaxID=1696 RepID=UPI00211CB0CF|nr:YciI family protein [Brevibacterium sp. 91QC2O2]MCQ9383988.1 YciI family protein [Brevibacterium sp. 68QC2CO]MCQ9389158.1 YciI family protein [Brevibacterium sp. 50QC2O2]
MAVFAVTYEYGPDTEKRMANRPAHRAWQGRLNEAGVILASGPLADDGVPGGLFVMEAKDRAAVEDLLTQDPYASLGVIATTTIRQWEPVFGGFANPA